MGTNSAKRRHCFSCVGFKREDVLDYDEDMAPTSTDSSGQFSNLFNNLSLYNAMEYG